ncbi:hypothetical protein HMPREF3159_03505 [Brachybacterium sp. HMSC06H03]|uniref:hypothetical protein n=1 Tax=Brachybacterium sp. HMSC06H03 TaxID=1581127 RepID=UPI0008A14207|nr:hypothetical protein [Brachybacterium sp. HMSC06H03]OFT62591.1 hypothetical protein HMPREF3159_03505 [Brachybacterium sp. HMSC06H03]
MSPYAIIRYLAYLVLVSSGASIVAGIVNADPAFALSNIALAFSLVTVIALASQLERKTRR